MPRKKKAEVIPKDLAHYYRLKIENILFPNDETGTSGSIIFYDQSKLNFYKETKYSPELQGVSTSIAECLLGDMVGFNLVLSNTNEIGFEFNLKDNSMLRQVPLGKPLNLTDEDLDRLSAVTSNDIERAKLFTKKRSPKLAMLLEANPIPTKEELDEAEQLMREKWKIYAPDKLKELFNKEVFLYDKENNCYIETATGLVVGRRELHEAMRQVNSNYTPAKKMKSAR